jgi:hypothetical protein
MQARPVSSLVLGGKHGKEENGMERKKMECSIESSKIMNYL